MSTKGTLKSNDFSRGAAKQGQVTREQKQAQRAELLAQARQKAGADKEQ